MIRVYMVETSYQYGMSYKIIEQFEICTTFYLYMIELIFE